MAEEQPRLEVHLDARGTEPPFVRPFGCHPEYPIVRRIGDRDLFLGNEHAADPTLCDRDFDFVLTVAEERAPATTHHRPMEDSTHIEWEQFRAGVDTARDLSQADGSLLIHCKAGISRSNTVIACTLACEEGHSLPEAYDIVRADRPHAIAHPQLRKFAAYYVAAAADRPPGADLSVVPADE